MFAALTTLPHFAISERSVFANWSGVPGIASAPFSSSRFFTSGSFRALTISAFNFATISLGVAAGTTIPEVIYHFTTGRYFLTAMANEDKPNDLTVNFPSDYFTAAAVQKKTTR